MNQGNLNDRAQERFLSLRKKLKLDLLSQEIEHGRINPAVDVDKLKKYFNEEKIEEPISISSTSAANEEFVDNSFAFIESLELPPKLSLAIGLIISAHKTENWIDLDNARKNIKEYLLFKGFGGINE